ncbi:30S ribosomal protein S17 [Candidatus Liberibacter brunswickensis]|uniref:30S ribosomal protein S17 n=1 Tax=Candidatus Liberibacter brunswickensis TaxID=1968796 RepID=UPI002FE1FCBC
MSKRVLQGVVVSDISEKTIIVEVKSFFSHNRYGKTIRSLKRYAVHDEDNIFKIGDLVSIEESPPFSKTKSWVVKYPDDS